MSHNKKLEARVAGAVAGEVADDNVPASPGSIEPITKAVVNELSPDINALAGDVPIYKSQVFWGMVFVALTRMLAHWGYAIPEELHGQALSLLVTYGPYIGLAIIAWGRWVKRNIIASRLTKS
jgi:hypothetical protein